LLEPGSDPEAAPDVDAPIAAVAAALKAATPVFQERYELARQRQAVIAANPGLQEHEMLKRAALASAMAEALRRRGVTDPAATLAAEVGVIAFKTALLAGPVNLTSKICRNSSERPLTSSRTLSPVHSQSELTFP
jgi:hypothetical protein